MVIVLYLGGWIRLDYRLTMIKIYSVQENFDDLGISRNLIFKSNFEIKYFLHIEFVHLIQIIFTFDIFSLVRDEEITLVGWNNLYTYYINTHNNEVKYHN